VVPVVQEGHLALLYAVCRNGVRSHTGCPELKVVTAHLAREGLLEGFSPEGLGVVVDVEAEGLLGRRRYVDTRTSTRAQSSPFIARLSEVVRLAMPGYHLRLELERPVDVLRRGGGLLLTALLVGGGATLLLVALFAGTQEVASLGALGRFSMVFAVVHSGLTLVIMPWFAQRPTSGGLHRRAYAAALGAFALLVGSVTLGLVLLRDPLLWLLGPHYTGLQQEFSLLMVSSALGVLSAAAYHLGAARNAYTSPGFYVVTSITVQAVAILLLDMSLLLDVILVGLLVNLWSLAVYAGGFLLFPARMKALPPGPG